MAEEQGAYKLLTNCPPCILFLEQGLELMQEASEPMGCGIFDFYKVFPRAFGERKDGVGGVRVGGGGCLPNLPQPRMEQLKFGGIHICRRMYLGLILPCALPR